MKKCFDLLCFAQQRWEKIIRAMKLTITLLLFAVLAATAGSTYSQTARINLKVQDASLVDVFREIERNSEFGFFFKNEEMDLSKRVSIDLKNATIEEVLKKILVDSYSYRILDKNIVVTKSFLNNYGQQGKKVTGKVTDSSGASMPGVSIVVKGTTSGTISDSNGNFTLPDVPENSTLQFSFVGMRPQEIVVGNKATVDVVLTEEAIGIEEVVAVGYGTQRKVNLTGAVSMVKMDDVLGNRPVTTIGSALQGAIPGLQITTTNGSPGASQTFNIRSSMGSINGGSPLILVDNVEMDINMLDPADIETVSVLKDAASSAIYGARAAFGVILITTKKGASVSGENKFTLTYSNNFSYSNPANLPQKATPLQTVQGYKDFGTTTYWSGHNVDTYLGYLNEYQTNPSKYPDGYVMGTDGWRYNLAETNLFSDMIETGFQQKHNFSAGEGIRIFPIDWLLGWLIRMEF